MLACFRFTLLLIGLLTVGCGTAFAQSESTEAPAEGRDSIVIPGDPVEYFNTRLQEVVSGLQAKVNVRASRFNSTINDFYKINILAPDNLDSAGILRGETRIRQFLRFLSDYRSETDTMLIGLRDSVEMLKSLLPEDYRDSIFRDMFTAHIDDEARFGEYTQALSNIYVKVLDLLSFLKTAQYKIRDHQLQFIVETDFKKYQVLNEPILAANKELERHVAELQKAQAASVTAPSKKVKSAGKKKSVKPRTSTTD